jgi:hypothetical protein
MLTTSDLCHFTGSETFHQWSGLFRYHRMTEGVKHLAESCGAFWLLDAIASHHVKACKKDRRMFDFQVWTLEKKKTGALLAGFADSNEARIVGQKLEFTDFFSRFSGDSVRLYVVRSDYGYTIMLPSEY